MNWFKENKYHNRKIVIDGMTFDSLKEGSHYQELRLRERSGEITGLYRQVKIEIVPKTDKFRASYYVCDFVYKDLRTGKTVYEDVKGEREGAAYQMFKLKQKLVYWRHGIEIKEI